MPKPEHMIEFIQKKNEIKELSDKNEKMKNV